MPNTMQAALLTGPCSIEVRELQVRAPQDDEICIRVDACGVCGSDIHMWRQGAGWTDEPRPIVLGHEFCGTVVDAGHSSFKVGDRVAFWANLYCGHCDFCREGQEHLCKEVAGRNYIGFVCDGGYAEYFTGRARNAYLLPEGVSDIAAATIDPLMVAWHAVKRAHIELNSKVLIAGCGIIGNFIAALCKKSGASYVAMTAPNEIKTRFSRRLGFVDEYFMADDPQLMAKLKAAGGDGFATAFEAVGLGSALNCCIEACRPGGLVVMIGNSLDPQVPFAMNAAVLHEITLMGSVSCTEQEFTETIGLIDQKVIQAEDFVSDVISLRELNATMQRQLDLNDPLLKAVVLPHS